MPGPQSPAEARVLSKVKVVLNAIADKSRADRWDALARLRLFCEGASSAEELESIGSKKAPTMRTLVEVLEEVGDAAARGSTEEAVLFDIVWLLECLLCSVTASHKVFLKQPNGIPLLLSLLRRAAEYGSEGRERLIEPATNALCCLTFHSSRACQQTLDAGGCDALAIAIAACLGAAAPAAAEPAASAPLLDELEPARARLACSLFELVINLCSMLPQAQEACAAAGLLEMLLASARTAVASHGPPDAAANGDGAGGARAGSRVPPIVTEQLLLALNSMAWCNGQNQQVVVEHAALETLLAHIFVWYSWSTQSRSHRARLPASYLASLLLVLCAQLDNQPAIEAVARTAQEKVVPALGGEGGSALARVCPLSDFVTLHHLILDQLLDIRHNHQHTEVVAEALGNSRRLVRHCTEAHYLFVHMHGALSVEMLLRCLGNVDETVLTAACQATSVVLAGSRRTQALFLRKHGVAVLRECALDYNADIQVRALQLLAMLAHAHPACRHELRDEGALKAVLKTLQTFPSEMPLRVLDPTLDLLCHVVTGAPRNQVYVREVGGLPALVELLVYLAEACCAPRARAAAEPDGHILLEPRRPPPICTQLADASAQQLSAATAVSPASEQAGPWADSAHATSPATTPGSVAGMSVANSIGGSMSLWPSKVRLRGRAADVAAANAAASVGGGAAQPAARAAAAAGGGGASAAGADAPSGAGVGATAPPRPRARSAGPPSAARSSLARAAELACLALNNVIYKQPASQAEALQLGVLRPCSALVLRDEVSDVTASALELLINLVDTNHAAQAQLGSDAQLLRRVVTLLLVEASAVRAPAEGAPPPGSEAAAAAVALRVRMSACLFVSHLTWNNKRTQAALADDDAAVSALLAILRRARSQLPAAAAAAAARNGGGAARAPAAGGAAGADSSAIPVFGAPAMPPAMAIGASAAASASASTAPIELSAYALMALVNLAYECARVQDAVGRAGGVQLLLELLGGPVESLHATASFCLSNVVKGHGPNARLAVEHGAPATLVSLITDDDDDELSKSAFVALVALEEAGAAALVHQLRRALERLDGGGAEAEAVRGVSAELGQLLPVLNGLVYTHAPAAAAVRRAGGLRALLGALQPARPLRAEVRVHAVHALLNLTTSRDRATQEEAIAAGGAGLVAHCLAHELGALEPAERGEAAAACCFLVLNLLLNNATAASELLEAEAADAALDSLAALCESRAESDAIARQPAAECFLQLCDQPTTQALMLARGSERVLQALAQSDMPELVTQKAASLLAERGTLGSAISAAAAGGGDGSNGVAGSGSDRSHQQDPGRGRAGGRGGIKQAFV